MENKLIMELYEKAGQAKSVEEILALAKEKGIELSEDDARTYFERQNKSGELSDDELDNVSGGGCYADDGRLVVTIGYSCKNFKSSENIDMPHRCFFCQYCDLDGVKLFCNHIDMYKR